MELNLYDRKDRVRGLQKFMAPEYSNLAFSLPPASGTFWGLMEDEIDRIAAQDMQPFTKDVNEVLVFLGFFFSTVLVERIAASFDVLSKSFMGIEYTLRQGKAMVAKIVLRDIQSECDVEGSALHNFFGHVEWPCDGDADDPDGGWQRQRRKRRESDGASRGQASASGNDESSVRDAGRRRGHGAGRGSGRGSGGGRGNEGEVVPELHFQSMDEQTVMVPMSPFSTPPYRDPNRHQTLKARSWEFISHGAVGDHGRRLYDPNYSQAGKVFVFHGTRTSCLSQFQMRGIDPCARANEFNRDATFYVSNSIRHAFEHPLHYHPSRNVSDPISVLVFELDVRILHGLEPPPGDPSLLTNLWFPDTEEREPSWQKFCIGNFKETRPRHSYDIVIGPICLPRDEGDWDKLRMSLPRNAPLTQLAFCSTRARDWLQRSFKRVYVETRAENDL